MYVRQCIQKVAPLHTGVVSELGYVSNEEGKQLFLCSRLYLLAYLVLELTCVCGNSG